MNKRRETNAGHQFLIVAGLIGFAVGVLGNLVAAWLQQELFRNAFMPLGVVFMLALAVLGVLLGAVVEQRRSKASSDVGQDKKRPRASQLQWTNIRLLWSRVKSRGHGIGLDRVFSLGSDIDIDTRDHEEDRDV